MIFEEAGMITKILMPYLTEKYEEWIQNYFWYGEILDNMDTKYYASTIMVLYDWNETIDDNLND